jgi:hypothetical protein
MDFSALHNAAGASVSRATALKVIKLVGRCPIYYPPGSLDALKGKRNLASLQLIAESRRRTHARRFTAPCVEVPQGSNDRSAATTVGRGGRWGRAALAVRAVSGTDKHQRSGVPLRAVKAPSAGAWNRSPAPQRVTRGGDGPADRGGVLA